MFVRLLIYQKSLKLIAVNLNRQKELDADTKAIQQIEFVGQLKYTDGVYADGTQSVCFNDFRKTQRNEIKIFTRKCNSLIKDDQQ